MAKIYMSTSGVQGNVTDKNYQNWIEIESLNFSVSRSVSNRLGNMSDRHQSSPQFSEVEIIKSADRASNEFFLSTCQGDLFNKIEIHLCSNGNDASPYMKYILSEVIVGEHAEFTEGGAKPREFLRLFYTEIEKTYIYHDQQNKPGAPNTVGFNLKTATRK